MMEEENLFSEPQRVSTHRSSHKAVTKKRGIVVLLRDLLVIFVIALLISFLVKTFLIRSFFIPSESMMNTLHVRDRIIVNQLEPKLIPVSRGDVVVFKDPGGWLEPTPKIEQNAFEAAKDWVFSVVGLSAPDSNDHLVKRVIALQGDTVKCCNSLGQLSVNNTPITEPYVTLPPGEKKVSRDDFSVTVPKDSLWVMGDNRYNSRDSRYNRSTPGNGFVPIGNIVGRAFVVSWPLENWKWLDNHGDSFRNVGKVSK